MRKTARQHSPSRQASALHSRTSIRRFRGFISPALLLMLPSIVDAGWKMTFSDEFSGAGLNTTQWKTSDAWNNRTYPGTGELQCYMPDAFSVGHGHLAIIAQRKVPPACKPNPGNLQFTSGMITTANSFKQLYGYFEMRAKLPKGKGLWPAFWLLPADRTTPPETDVMEAIGSNPNSVQMTNHWKDPADQSRRGSGAAYSGPDFTANFHTFGVDWQPGVLTWYVDGVKRREFTGSLVMAKPAYLLANLAVGGGWAGSPDETTKFPALMQVDSIRAYQRVDDGLPDALPPFAAAPDVSTAPTVVQGETMGRTTNTSGALYQDGTIWALWNNGYIQSTVSFPLSDTYTFTVRMGGNSDAGAFPRMELRIDGETVASAKVSRGWTPVNYRLKVPVSGGQHLVAVALTNGYDWETATGDYRFLLVDRLAVTGSSATAVGDPDPQSGWNGPDFPFATGFSGHSDLAAVAEQPPSAPRPELPDSAVTLHNPGGSDGPPAPYFSLAADRSHPKPLQGAAVSGRIHIFAAAEPAAAKARFLLDGVTVKIENRSPFDFAGTAPDGTARAFDSAVLSPGLHTLTIRRTMNDGSEAPAVSVRFRR